MAYHPFRHLGLKFLAVAVAVGLWFTVVGEQTVERGLRAPLELRNRPDYLALIENPPSTVEVRVRGPAGLLSQLGPGDVIAMVDLSQARAGRKHFTLTSASVRSPFGVEVVEVTPTSISLRFEPSVTRRVPVTPIIEGEPAPGYVEGLVTVDPTTIEVTGPETALSRLKDAVTDPVSISGARQRVREEVTISVIDPSLKLKSSASATVTIQVQAKPVDRIVARVPIRLRNVGRGLAAQAEPSAVVVVVRGPQDVVESLQAEAVMAFVNLAGLVPGRYNLSVRVEPPPDFTVVRTEPATVRVRIR